MMQKAPPAAASPYETDETAWLEATADLLRRGRWDLVDAVLLADYLADMARRDRREVSSRLATLLAHLLKWRHQPDRRTGSWRTTIEVQRQELEELLESGTLRLHAEGILEKAYRNGVRQAAAESGLPESEFPQTCPYSLEDLLAGSAQ